MKTRAQALQSASTREFDLVVIGGGIAGAGVAQDAACRGLSVLLVEKDDFASGTSSKTTKLIHGGLRYLEQLHFRLTHQLCQERALLQQLAPHMVRDFSFVMPFLRENFFFNLKASLGLTLYDLLSLSAHASPKHERLEDKEVLELAPALSSEALNGGLRFHDCITDDARMVIEVLKSASREGAIAVNYLEAAGFELQGGRIRAVRCRDRLSGNDLVVRTRSCVNTTGVWSDNLCQMLDANWRAHLAPSKGIHIVVPLSAFETNTALFLPTRDRRYVFVVPWHRTLMIGTTDTPYKGDLDRPLPSLDEIDYLLSVVNSYTATHKLNRSDIKGTFAGLRPLVRPPSSRSASNTSGISREHLIFEGPGGIVCAAGGKLTNYRLMAEEIVDRVLQQLPNAQAKQSRTRRLMLGGWADKQDFLTVTAAISARARRLGLEPAVLDHLIESYGAEANEILDLVEKDPSLIERISSEFPFIMGEIPFCVVREMAVSLEDMLMRRLRLGMLNQKECLACAPKVASVMELLLRWDDNRTVFELAALESSLALSEEQHLRPLAGRP